MNLDDAILKHEKSIKVIVFLIFIYILMSLYFDLYEYWRENNLIWQLEIIYLLVSVICPFSLKASLKSPVHPGQDLTRPV